MPAVVGNAHPNGPTTTTTETKPRWQLFEEHTIAQFRQIANGNPSDADEPLVKALRGARVYGPWRSDVPAGPLASIGFLAYSAKEQRAIQHAAPDKCGWTERGGDGIIVCANDWIIALQMKDVAHAGHASNLNRFLTLCVRVKRYNDTLDVPDDFGAPCGILAVAPDTRISERDRIDYRDTHDMWVHAMPNFSSSQPRAPLTSRELREAEFYAANHGDEPEETPPALPVPPPVAPPPPRGKIKGGNTERERLAAERKANRAAARPLKAVKRTFQDTTVKTICNDKGLHLVRGPTGCGKTTIIGNVLGNLLTPPPQMETRSGADGAAQRVQAKWYPPFCFLVAPYIQHARQLYNALEGTLKLRLGADWESKVLFVASEQVRSSSNGNKPSEEAAEGQKGGNRHYQSCAVKTQEEMDLAMDTGVCVFIATDKSSELLLELAERAHERERQIFVVSDEAHFDSGAKSSIMELLRKVDVNKGDTGIAASATPDGNVLALPGLQKTLELDYNVAIQNRWIADYKIVLPLVHDVSKTLDGEPLAMDVQTLLSAHPEDDIGAAALFTVQGMYIHGKRRCIAYARDSWKSAVEAQRALHQACDLIGVRCESQVVLCKLHENESDDSDTTMSQAAHRLDRDEAIRSFSEDPTRVEEEGRNEFGEACLVSKPLFRFLIGVRILDQCLDFPLCDAVAIMTPPQGADSTNKSAHRAMQRLGRSLRYKFRGDTSRCYIFADPQSEWLNAFLDCLADFDSGVRKRTSAVSANPADLTKPKARPKAEIAERATVKAIMDRYEVHRRDALVLTIAQKLEALAECAGDTSVPPKKDAEMERCHDDGTEEGTMHKFAYGEFAYGIMGNFVDGAKAKYVLDDEQQDVAWSTLPWLGEARKTLEHKHATHGIANKLRQLLAFLDTEGRKPVAKQPGQKVCTTPEQLHEQRMASFVNNLVSRPEKMRRLLGAEVYDPLMVRIRAMDDAVQEREAVADIQTIIATCVQKVGKDAPWPLTSGSRGRKRDTGSSVVQTIAEGTYRFKAYAHKWCDTYQRELEASVLCQPVAEGADDVHAKARMFLRTLIAHGREAQDWKRAFMASEPERRANGEVDLPPPKGKKKQSAARAVWFKAKIRAQWIATKLAVGLVEEKPVETPEQQAKRERRNELQRKKDAKRQRKAKEAQRRAQAIVEAMDVEIVSDPE